MAEVAVEVVAIDNFINLWTDEPNIEEQFRDNVQRYGVSDKIKLLVGDSSIWLESLWLRNLAGVDEDYEEKFDFIFVDGNHEDPIVKYDSEWACRLIKPNGYIAWHDSDHPPVASAIAEVVGKYPLTKVEEDGMLHVYQFRS